MQMICLDLEGVLVPEIWIAFAERTGIAIAASAQRPTTLTQQATQALMIETFASVLPNAKPSQQLLQEAT